MTLVLSLSALLAGVSQLDAGPKIDPAHLPDDVRQMMEAFAGRDIFTAAGRFILAGIRQGGRPQESLGRSGGWPSCRWIAFGGLPSGFDLAGFGAVILGANDESKLHHVDGHLSDVAMSNPFTATILEHIEQATPWLALCRRQYMWWFADFEARADSDTLRSGLRAADQLWREFDDADNSR